MDRGRQRVVRVTKVEVPIVDVRAVRLRLGLSQSEFAVKFGFCMLRDAGEAMYMTPQNLVEFWSVATGPREKNGLGLVPGQADVIVREIERIFPIVPDTPAIYPEWKSIVVSLAVSGRQVHDARLVAVMRVYGLTHLLTFNLDDFTRYPITAVSPHALA